MGRVTVFERLRDLGLRNQHIMAVGRLDYLSEGLMIMTNDGDLARALEMPNYAVERAYKVRVFGRMFKDEYIAKLRQGFKISG